MIPAIERAIQALRVLPGVGKKTAAKYVYALLAEDVDGVTELASAVQNLKQQIKQCQECHNYTEGERCEICENRHSSTVCVVETPGDVFALDRTGRFSGNYHVLHGLLNPIGGVTLADLTVDSLVERVRSGRFSEVLLALSPTQEGEATSRLIATLLGEFEVEVTRLAFGLPLGTQLEYLDDGTLSLALDHRRHYPESL